MWVRASSSTSRILLRPSVQATGKHQRTLSTSSVFRSAGVIADHHVLQWCFDGCQQKSGGAQFLAPQLANGLQRRNISLGAPGKTIMTISPSAQDRVVELMEIDKECTGIKIALRQRGCSGMSYVMDFMKGKPNKFDEIIEFENSKKQPGRVYVDSQAVLFLVGTEMDFVEVEMGSEFVFNNPNKKSECGCGQSFNV